MPQNSWASITAKSPGVLRAETEKLESMIAAAQTQVSRHCSETLERHRFKWRIELVGLHQFLAADRSANIRFKRDLGHMEGRIFTSEEILAKLRFDRSSRCFEVEVNKRWLTLPNFLNGLAKVPPFEHRDDPTHINFHSGYEYHRQRQWWDDNGKTFKFFLLPGELRNEIYTLLLNLGGVHKSSVSRYYGLEHIWTIEGHIAGWAEPDSGSTRDSQPILPRHQLPLPLFLVSKRLHSEFAPLAQAGVSLRMSGALPRIDLSPSRTPTIALQQAPWLRSLTLRLSLPELLQLFGVAYDSYHDKLQNPIPFRKAFSKLSLDSLELDMPHRICSARSSRCWIGWTCHRISIGLVLMAALQHISHIPKVDITGCVRTGVSRDYLTLLDETRKEVSPVSIGQAEIIGVHKVWGSNILENRGSMRVKCDDILNNHNGCCRGTGPQHIYGRHWHIEGCLPGSSCQSAD